MDAHLKPGDVFIDAGAHWGVHTLTAATRWPGQVNVLAIEPVPSNLTNLIRMVQTNAAAIDTVEIIAAAVGARAATAPLRANTTMGHSVSEIPIRPIRPGAARLAVPVVTMDALLAERPELAHRRIILKADVEGCEPEIIAGAQRLLASGRVAAVVWEKGDGYGEPELRRRYDAMMAELESFGFTHYRFPHLYTGGPLIPIAPTHECFNVFSLAPNFERQHAYVNPLGVRAAINEPLKAPAKAEDWTARAQGFIVAGASDPHHWTGQERLRDGAAERAKFAARLVPDRARILDVGCGAMALRTAIGGRCHYTPADIVPWAPDCLVIDLNQAMFPEGSYDCIAMLEVLEFVHDVAAVLAWAANAAEHLICSYRFGRQGENSEESGTGRHRRGWVNDYSEDQFHGMLSNAGWRIGDRVMEPPFTLFDCRRD